MTTTLRLLLVEDSADDAELLLHEVRRGGLEPFCERVDTAEGMAAALARQEWDIIIADYVMPTFSGIEALELLKERMLDLPFIIVSGRVGEDLAVDAMRSGASDYLLKGNLKRLVPIIRRELEEAQMRRERRRAEAELTLLKKAIETLPIGVTITDIERHVIYTNPAEARMHGYSVDELVGMNVRMLAPQDTWREVTIEELRVLRSLSRESVNIRNDRSTFPAYLISNVITDANDIPYAIISTCEDITARKRVEEKLRQQYLAMESSMDGMAIVNEEGKFSYLNQAHALVYGYSNPGELVGLSWKVLFEPDEAARMDREIMPTLRREGKWRGETKGRRRSGDLFPQEMSLTVIEGGSIICVVRDTTERKFAEERLRYMSTHDTLTGFYNRAYFEEELERIGRSRLFPVSVVMADVDGLKEVNDTLGHSAGDELLRNAAKVLMSVFRAEDMVARIGGDEFVVLLPESDATAADKALARIREMLADFNANHDGPCLSLSLGAATAEESARLTETLRLADERMYAEKQTRHCRQGKHRANC